VSIATARREELTAPLTTPQLRTRRHPGRWVSGIVLVLIVGFVLNGLISNPRLEWGQVWGYLFDVHILSGLGVTLALAVVAEIVALALGMVIGFCRVSRNPVAKTAAAVYVWLFRGIPLIVLVLLVGNIALFIPEVRIGIPFTDVEFFSASTNALVSTFVAGVIALSLHDAAYNAEIYRSGIISVPDGQRLAAQALGLTWWQTQLRVVLPQALPVMIPPAMSQFVTLLKSTAMVSVIAVGDLLTEAQHISALNQYVIELLFVATIWYLVAVSVASVLSRLLDSKSEKLRH